MRLSYGSSDVFSSDLRIHPGVERTWNRRGRNRVAARQPDRVLRVEPAYVSARAEASTVRAAKHDQPHGLNAACCFLSQPRSHRKSWPSESRPFRSAEHTSELQSLMRISYAVF